MSGLWTIEPLLLHTALVPGPEVLFQADFDRRIKIAVFAFLLTSDSGETVLVDTGLPLDYRDLNAAVRRRKGDWSGFHDAGEPLVARLRQRRIAPAAIILSSFGPYATGALSRLAAPRCFVSARGLANLDRPEVALFSHPIGSDAETALRRASDPVTGKAEPFRGLTIHEVGIHHPASMAVIVETDGGRIAIADPVFHAENLIRGLPLGVAEYPAHWVAMVAELCNRVDAILPIHDPAARPVAVAAIDGRLRSRVAIAQRDIEW